MSLSEAIDNGEELFFVDCPIALCGREGLCVRLNRVMLLCPVNLVVMRNDAGYCLVAPIGFHDCLEVSIELDEDGRGVEFFLNCVKGLLLLLSLSEGHILG